MQEYRRAFRRNVYRNAGRFSRLICNAQYVLRFVSHSHMRRSYRRLDSGRLDGTPKKGACFEEALRLYCVAWHLDPYYLGRNLQALFAGGWCQRLHLILYEAKIAELTTRHKRRSNCSRFSIMFGRRSSKSSMLPLRTKLFCP